MKTIITYSNQNGQTRFKTDPTIKDIKTIMHTIHAYSHYFGTEPSFDEIAGILTRSSHALDKRMISKRLDHLRKSKIDT